MYAPSSSNKIVKPILIPPFACVLLLPLLLCRTDHLINFAISQSAQPVPHLHADKVHGQDTESGVLKQLQNLSCQEEMDFLSADILLHTFPTLPGPQEGGTFLILFCMSIVWTNEMSTNGFACWL